ncbi:MAG: hypothetical protein ACRC3H_04405 [Lachnospiraceae bacterium]
MREKAAHEIESSSRALQVFLCITLLLTVVLTVLTFKGIIENVTNGKALAGLIKQVIYYLFYIAIQLFAIMIFRNIAQNKTPFLPVVARNIKIIGGLIMFSNALATWISEGILFFSGGADEYGMTILDESIAMGLVLGLVFFCLGAAFDYGCVLQQQDDELL